MADDCVLVLGTGLIGTSIGLALRAAGRDVLLADADLGTAAAAAERGAGRAWDGREPAELAVVAVPPTLVAQELTRLQRLDIAATYTHVTSVQSQVQAEIEALSPDASSVVGGHPMAGRETSGPAGASADLFVGRPWVICPSAASRSAALAEVHQLAEDCGAVPTVVDALEHDRAVAVLSHLPQVAASALAAVLVPEDAPAVATALAGTGLADTTRLAASASGLWTEILTANAEQVAPAVRSLVAVLEDLAAALDTSAGPVDADRVRSLLERGNRGRALVPVKRGVRDSGFVAVAVEVDDRPGRLAALLADAGAAGVNVEDVRVDHVPGRPTGIIELLVAVPAAAVLETALGRDWHVIGSQT